MRRYAEALFDKDGTSNVWVVPGRMTAKLRRRWGFYLSNDNYKNRDDHRHHALDAAVIGLIDRALVQQLQAWSRKYGASEINKHLLPPLPEKIEEIEDERLKELHQIRAEVRQRIAQVQASHRPNHASRGHPHHSTGGALHEETAYGQVPEEEQEAQGLGNLVFRKSVEALEPGEIKRIRDGHLRAQLQDHTQGHLGNKKALREALQQWGEDFRGYETEKNANRRHGTRSLRIVKRDQSARQIPGQRKWVIPGENLFVEILEQGGKWLPHVVDRWANASRMARPWHEAYPGAKFIMRLYKGDTIQLYGWDRGRKTIIPDENQVKRVISIKMVELVIAGVNEGGTLPNRHNDPEDRFRWDRPGFDRLRQRRARRVRIDETGRLRVVPMG